MRIMRCDRCGKDVDELRNLCDLYDETEKEFCTPCIDTLDKLLLQRKIQHKVVLVKKRMWARAFRHWMSDAK